MSGRLLWIEVRRNDLLLLFPVVVALYGFVAWESVLVHSVLFWAENSVWARNSIVLLGPFAGAVAAWMAGRERRRGLDDLIATTPRPALIRDLTIVAATSLLGIMAYVVIAVGILGRTATRASWDGPYLSVLVPGLFTIVAMAAVGYPIGRTFPRRVTAILVGAGLIIAIALPITIWDSWPEFLSPLFEADASPWWGIQPEIALPQSIFLLGIAYLGLAGIAAVSGARRVALPVLLVAIVTSAVGVGTIRGGGARAEGEREIIAYEPVCAGNPVTVCVHPAFEPVLDKLVDGANAMATPFIGLDSMPTRLVQRAPNPDGRSGLFEFEFDGPVSSGVGFSIEEPVHGGAVFAAQERIANILLGEPDALASPEEAVWQAHKVIVLGLLETAGYDLTCKNNAPSYEVSTGLLGGSGFGYEGVPCDEFERFVALDPAARNEWLRQNYAALRAGEIGLEDLP
ncbi:MAG: hypothetical protein ACRDJW_02180 [Thermomicrobiales bacterium]